MRMFTTQSYNYTITEIEVDEFSDIYIYGLHFTTSNINSKNRVKLNRFGIHSMKPKNIL